MLSSSLSVGSIIECLIKPPWYPLANADGLQRPVLQIYACRNSVSSTLTPPLLLLCRRRPRTWLHNKAVGDMPILDGMSAAREESILRKWGQHDNATIGRCSPAGINRCSGCAPHAAHGQEGAFEFGDPETAEPRWALPGHSGQSSKRGQKWSKVWRPGNGRATVGRRLDFLGPAATVCSDQAAA